MLQSSQSEQAITGSSTSRGQCCSVVKGEQAGSICRATLLLTLQCVGDEQALACPATSVIVLLHTPARSPWCSSRHRECLMAGWPE